LAYARVTGNEKYLIDRLPDLDRDYAGWEKERRLDDGLFWQYDVQDGMEGRTTIRAANTTTTPLSLMSSFRI